MAWNDMIAVRALVREGHGVSRMPHFIGGNDPALAQLPETDLSPDTPIRALTHPDLLRAPLLVGFLRFIAGHFATRAAYHAGPDAR